MKTPSFQTAPIILLILATLSVAPPAMMGSGRQIGEPAPPRRLAEILQAPEGADGALFAYIECRNVRVKMSVGADSGVIEA